MKVTENETIFDLEGTDEMSIRVNGKRVVLTAGQKTYSLVN